MVFRWQNLNVAVILNVIKIYESLHQKFYRFSGSLNKLLTINYLNISWHRSINKESWEIVVRLEDAVPNVSKDLEAWLDIDGNLHCNSDRW